MMCIWKRFRCVHVNHRLYLLFFPLIWLTLYRISHTCPRPRVEILPLGCDLRYSLRMGSLVVACPSESECPLVVECCSSVPYLANDGSVEGRPLQRGDPGWDGQAMCRVKRSVCPGQELSRHFWELVWGNIYLTGFPTIMWVWVFCLDIN